MARHRPHTFSLRTAHPPDRVGLAAAAASVAAITGLIYPLKSIAPAVSSGPLYLLAVLLVSVVWGRRLGLVTALASAVAFNFFHLPPTGRLTIANTRDWVALGVFLLAAAAASTVADAARTRAEEAELRAQEADLVADLARLLLGGAGGAGVAGTLGDAGRRLGAALGAPAAVRLGAPAAGELALHDAGGEPIGALSVRGTLDGALRRRLEERIVPSLQALLAAALERERLMREVVQTEALRHSDDVKTALLRAVSHDLRTPLTAIAATAEALRSPSLTAAEHEELVASVAHESERLAALVEKLLDLSRLDAGQAPPRLDWIAVEEVVRGAIESQHLPPERFRFAFDRELPLVRADAAQLDRALANLLENAVRWSGEQLVSVRARLVGQRVMIRIVDRGPGVPAAELERIFEPFYRAGNDPVPHGGAGLGLAIARGFVEANGGRLWAESLPGQGTSFVIALPLEQRPEAAPGPAPAPGEVARAAPASEVAG